MGQSPDLVALEARFDAAMLQIYESAGRELGYWATRYLQLVRRRGGLGAARYLLAQRITSDGYARLREADRLDLTVEALVLQPEFGPLFSARELDIARERLEQYRSMPTSDELAPGAELLHLVTDAAAAPVDERIDYRDRIAAFGSPAIIAMQRWVGAGQSIGFAIAVIEAVGRASDKPRAVATLHSIRARYPDWADVASMAISRLGRSGADRARTQAPAQVVRRPGVLDEVGGHPPAAQGPCQFLTKDGKPCRNPGRYWREGRWSCSRNHSADSA